MRVLEIRFGKVPQPLTLSIAEIDDLDKLEMLHEKAVTVETVEKFKSFLADAPPSNNPNGE